MKKEKFFKKHPAPLTYLAAFARWCVLGVITGIFGGILGAAFTKAITYATNFRLEHSWIIYFLPIGGLVIVFLYRSLKLGNAGTNEIFETVRNEKKIPVRLLPAVFSGSIISHLFGGSVGREGAALQIGGSLAALFSKILKLDDKKQHILIMCGMSAAFSAVFCAPLTAAIFSVEVICVGYLYSSALLPCLISSLTAYAVSLKLGIKPDNFKVDIIPKSNLKTLIFVVLLAIIASVVSVVFCKSMHISSHLFEKYLKNEYLRIASGGLLIVILTVVLKTTDYNGSGINVIENIFLNGEVKYEAFLLKIIFTAITIGVGYKGGEIVPTMFIGATLGASVAKIAGMPISFGAALGISSLFCSVTNCPLATVLLSIEFFGTDGIIFYTLSAFISFLVSGYASLYTGQKIVFSKTSDEEINIAGK
ncbi:MAG: chloride channel protein [Clostridia bacterium]|nr:chloride channel protein [Clostridia bacterium]